MKIKAESATLNEVEVSGKKVKFIMEQLFKFADTAKGKIITDNFHSTTPPIGKVDNAWVEDGRLMVEATLFTEMDLTGKYLVPMWLIAENRVVELAITDNPSDKTLNTILIIKESPDTPRCPISDKERLDWLVHKAVEVRTPLFYGSRLLFHARDISEEGEEHRTILREQIDNAIRKGY